MHQQNAHKKLCCVVKNGTICKMKIVSHKVALAYKFNLAIIFGLINSEIALGIIITFFQKVIKNLFIDYILNSNEKQQNQIVRKYQIN